MTTRGGRTTLLANCRVVVGGGQLTTMNIGRVAAEQRRLAAELVRGD